MFELDDAILLQKQVVLVQEKVVNNIYTEILYFIYNH